MTASNAKPLADFASAAMPATTLRQPDVTDGARVHDLIAACPPLDANSLYCNLLQCTHFAETCILATQGREPVGWISGYRPPRDPSTLFVWQVAVHEKARGTGLAKRMLLELLKRPALGDVRFIRTTVTPGNEASRAFFRSVARRIVAPMHEESGFEQEAHFHGRHESERLIVIGPLSSKAWRKRCP